VAPKKLVAEMVLHDGDLQGFTVSEAAVEKLKNQYPPPHAPHRAALVRLVRRSWLASAHSVIADNNGDKIMSDVNLFRSTAATKALWSVEQRDWEPRDVTVTQLAVPHGAPKGAKFYQEVGEGRRVFAIQWQQETTIAWVAVVLPAKARLSIDAPVRIAIVLRDASQRLAHRIAHPNSGVIISGA
jgi:hypothetical protein